MKQVNTIWPDGAGLFPKSGTGEGIDVGRGVGEGVWSRVGVIVGALVAVEKL